jgi:Prokaryotic dksA/traR C4-type zinc finger
MTSDEKDCERCGALIPPRRLEVLPNTRLCIECSEAIGGDYKTFVIPENTGKPGSLKKNYGSWIGHEKTAPHHADRQEITNGRDVTPATAPRKKPPKF